MKKIALLHFAYPPNIGGVETIVKEHAQMLVNLGYEVKVVVGSGEEIDPRIKLAVVPEFQSVLNFNPFLQEKILQKGIIDKDFYDLSEKIGQELAKNLQDIDVVIVHNMVTIVRNLPFVHAFTNFVKQFPKKKYFAWTHDHTHISQFKISNLAKEIKSPMEKELMTKPIKHVKYVLISQSFKEPLEKIMGLKDEDAVVIPDGIDIKQFLEVDELIWKIVEKYGLLKSFPVILSPVNIVERKNLEYCLDIVHHLKKTYPGIRYLITGQPSKHRLTVEYLVKLKNQVKDLGLQDNVVFFYDFLNRALMTTEIHDLYQLSDLVFFMSKSENFGLPLVEASLTKTPIFVSDLKVFREVGGEYIKYLDYNKVSPETAAGYVKEFLDGSRRVRMNYHCRMRYDLKTIIGEKLIPLIEGS